MLSVFGIYQKPTANSQQPERRYLQTEETMFKKKLRISDYIIILANLIPVYGVWFLGWSAREAFVIYAMETIILGLLTILKLLIATLYRGTDKWYANNSVSQVSGLFFIFFFTIHYGLFVAIQTSLISSSITTGGKDGFFHFFFHWYEYIDSENVWILGGFVASYLATDLFPFLAKGQYRTVPMMLLMFQPYGRIFVQQVIVIIGSMFLALGSGKGFILVFAVVKIIADLYLSFDKIINKAMTDMEKETIDNKQ
jgi:hypothetical protein